MNNLFDLKGKTAIVTGASTGLGQGMSLGLASAGADILLIDHVPSEETLKELNSLGIKAEQFVINLLEQGAVQTVVEKALEVFGKVDILINNAGTIRRTPAIDFSEKDWDEVMNLNSRVVFFLSQAVAKDMMKRKYGKIINIASLLSFQGGIIVPSYSASKGAVAQITKALANEWAKFGLNINAIAPGYFATNNTKALRADPVRSKSILDRIPAERWGTPADLQGAAIYLASKASDYVNGHVLVVDGGWLAR
jgi:2-deoxy-D-gluconate 3-dehydrogenase